MTFPTFRAAFISFTLATTPLAAQALPTLSTISPGVVAAESAVRLTVTGTELDQLTSFELSKPGVAPISLIVLSQTPASVELGGALATAPVGLYSLLAGDGDDTCTLADAVEVTRPVELKLDGFTRGADVHVPFGRATLQSNVEVLVPASDIGRGGWLVSVALPCSLDPHPFSGYVLMRVKHASETAFAVNNLDNTGWYELYGGPVPPTTGGQIKLSTTGSGFLYDGTSSLVVSIVFETASPSFQPIFPTFVAAEPRYRWGTSNLNLTPAATWTGDVPAGRWLTNEVPVMELGFEHSGVMADFSADQTAVVVGEPVTFSNSSTGVPNQWEWDFDGDGVVDSTAVNPTHTYTTPGTYDVELVVSRGFLQDSHTRRSYVVVSPASGLDFELNAE